MKFRTMLLASAAVMFTTSAFAEDFTNPFYLPAQGKVISDTRIETSRMKMDDGAAESADKSLIAAEELTVGVVDNLALVGRIRNHFDVDEEYNNDHNFDYKIGAKYNMAFGQVMTQVGFAYNTYDPESWYGQNYSEETGLSDRWSKALEGTVKLGYAFDCGLTPYTSFTVNGDIDQAVREQEYSWFVGAHKAWEKVAVDGGLRYDWGRNIDEEGSDKTEALFAQAQVDYFVKDNVTVGAYGDLYLGGDERKDVDYGYTLGLAAKVLF